MRDFRDAKVMAQTLREALAARSVSLTHGESLELVAKILGFRDWNTLSARIQSQSAPAAAPVMSTPARLSLPIVPLRDIVLFPDAVSPIFIGRETTKRAVEEAIANDACILAVTQRRATEETLTADALYAVGVTAKVLDLAPLGDGSMRGIIRCLKRAAITHFSVSEFLLAEIDGIEETRENDSEAFKLARTVLDRLETFLNIDFSVGQAPYARLPRITHLPRTFADAVAPLLPIGIGQRQELLETPDVVSRLEKILAIVASDRQAAAR
ncbi:MAG: LON peptidase substrate-binding domain-containing protein [Hyphomicrobiales bacterium]|nr:LON peptidase substrate-binding domain-containing protein [Hyphomicrobiales bacterium]